MRAINIAATDRSRPRYLIDLTDVEAFENARQVVPDATPKPARRRKPTAIKDYFVTDATAGEQWAALEQQQAVPTAKRPELEARP